VPDELPTGIFVAIVVLQLLIAAGLIVLLIRLRRAVKAQGLSMSPKDIAEKLKRRSGGSK
jgi:hypothetical protein